MSKESSRGHTAISETVTNGPFAGDGALLAAACSATQRGRDAVGTLEAAESSDESFDIAAKAARGALYEMFLGFMKGYGGSELYKRDQAALVKLIQEQVLGPQFEEFNKLREEFAGVAQMLRTVAAEDSERFLELFLPRGRFRDLWRSDFPDDKRKISQYTAQKFFAAGQLRCFVQASSTAIHFGIALNEEEVVDGSFFYTNSSVFPVTVLGGKRHHHVYAFCGPNYDPVCAAWLFSESDHATKTEVENLFTRGFDPLTTAFLMPAVITPEEGLHFHRDDTAELARTLLEVATHVVVMAVGDRICLSPELKNERHPPTCIASLDDTLRKRKRISIIVSGAPRSGKIDAFVDGFTRMGIETAWLGPMASNWIEEYPCDRPAALR